MLTNGPNDESPGNLADRSPAHRAPGTFPWLRIIIRPRLMTFNVGVHAITSDRIDLLCNAAQDAGTIIAIRWDYGPHTAWRTLRGTVTASSPAGDGRWVVRCALHEPLHPWDVQALLLGDRRGDYTWD